MVSFSIIMIVVLVVSALAGLCTVKADRTDFNRRFPPIDDDAFVARCSSGVNRDIALRVRRIVAEQLGVEYARIYPSSRFVEDLGAD